MWTTVKSFEMHSSFKYILTFNKGLLGTYGFIRQRFAAAKCVRNVETYNHFCHFSLHYFTYVTTRQASIKKEYYKANKIGKKSTASAVAAVLLVREFV